MTGGPPVPIVEVDPPNGASWGDDDVIVFAMANDAVYTVPAAGGVASVVAGTEGAGYLVPWVLPGGGVILVRVSQPGASNDEARIVALDLGTGEADTLGFATRVAHASGHLLLSSADGTLLVQPFDLRERRTTGQAVAILDAVDTGNPPEIGEFAVSQNGGLAYQTGAAGLNESLVVHGPGGATEIPLPTSGNYEDPSFSPDGRRVAVSIGPEGDPGYHIWIWDRDQRTQQLLTVEGEDNESPVWSPDGSRIAFARTTEGEGSQIYWQHADGSGRPERLLETQGPAHPSQFSADGRFLLFASRREDGDGDIGLLDLDADTVRWLVETGAHDYHGQLSPDGRWLAYTSQRSGQPEVYVQALDGTGGRTQVSAAGGHSPRWAPDGGTLYFATGEGEPVVAATVSADDRFRVTAREEAFQGPDDFNVPGTTTWDVSPDGEEFLYISRNESAGGHGFVWILNWPMILREMAGGQR